MKVIRLTESELHNVINETVKSILKEEFGQEWNYGNDNEWDDDTNSKESYSIKDQYYKLMTAIEDFKEVFENIYDLNEVENQEIFNALEMVQEKVNDFVRHPEGRDGDTKIWDKVGF